MIVLANNISLHEKDTSKDISHEDLTQCKKLAEEKNVFELLAKNVAQTIRCNDYVKKALLSCLLSSRPKKEEVLPSEKLA